VLSADFVAGSAADLLGVAVAGVLVSAFGVPVAIGSLGVLVTVAAVLLALADRRGDALARSTPSGRDPEPATLAPTRT
jgi:hypothetical protein